MTQKPISTISYNTEPFLKGVLEMLLKQHIIQNYCFIFHYGEDGDKDHFHVRLEPNKRIDPMDIKELFREFDPNNIKPLFVRPFRPSVEEDWLLYVVHDKEYLKIKYGGGEKGEKIPYSWQDIKCPDDYDCEIAFIRAKSKLKHTSSNLAKSLCDGEKPINLIMQGENVHTVNALMQAFRTNDYTRLQEQYHLVSCELDSLYKAIKNKGLTVEFDDNGNMFLSD